MSFRSAFPAFIAAATLPASVVAAPPSIAAATPETALRRVELKPTQGQALPYTIEVPQEWQVRQVEGYPGLWLGPAEAKPPEDARLIWVRGSQASLAKPDEIVASIRARDAKESAWSAPRVEVKEVGGIHGVLVRMDSGEGNEARSTLTLKLPLANAAVDFVTSAPRAEFEKQLPLYERILLSVRPVASK